MAKFYGEIGFGESLETVPGVYKDVITERTCYGDVLVNNQRYEAGLGVNKDVSLSNRISIISDDEIMRKLSSIRYVNWLGTRWTVSSLELQTPRLIIQIGEVYNGPTPSPSNNP